MGGQFELSNEDNDLPYCNGPPNDIHIIDNRNRIVVYKWSPSNQWAAPPGDRFWFPPLLAVGRDDLESPSVKTLRFLLSQIFKHDLSYPWADLVLGSEMHRRKTTRQAWREELRNAWPSGEAFLQCACSWCGRNGKSWCDGFRDGPTGGWERGVLQCHLHEPELTVTLLDMLCSSVWCAYICHLMY